MITVVMFCGVLVVLSWRTVPVAAQKGEADPQVPILVYHRFGMVVADTMTIPTATFAAHLRYLHEHGYTIMSLRQFVRYRQGLAEPPPPRAVILTVDDAHASVFTEMLPLVKQYKIPVTLFVYPSAISNASYAMTWEQLRVLQETGLFDIQSHTYWHPKFTAEKRRRTAADYRQFVADQLTRSRDILQEKLHHQVDLLAWPFGLYDAELMAMAQQAGYIAAFSIERRHASDRDAIMALPRYLLTAGDRGTIFERLVAEPVRDVKRK
jgi:peptidoglycan/xylan/chitin deacetylase (PgdA/CDA1 family)